MVWEISRDTMFVSSKVLGVSKGRYDLSWTFNDVNYLLLSRSLNCVVLPLSQNVRFFRELS
jgi:hypothetical protein